LQCKGPSQADCIHCIKGKVLNNGFCEDQKISDEQEDSEINWPWYNYAFIGLGAVAAIATPVVIIL